MLRRIILAASVCLPLAFACSSPPRNGFVDPADAGGPAKGNDDADAGFKGDAAPPLPGALACSDDLHSVIDQAGAPIKTCPPDQGCAPGGTCVVACDSAKQNQSTLGCEYFNHTPDALAEVRGACYAAFVANTWTTPIALAVEYAGQSLDVAQFARVPSGSGKNLTYAPLPGGQLAAGQVAVLFLSHWSDPARPLGDVPCPIPAAIEGSDPSVHGTGLGSSFHVTSSAPVVAYDIFPYGGGNAAATAASLLLPTSAWDKNYLAINAFTPSVVAAQAGAVPTLDILAAEDGTLVTIRPAAAIVGGNGVAAAAPGKPVTYALSKGQLLQLAQPEELSGSPVQANKPIAVFGGATGLNVDPTTCCADTAHQQIPPVSALGSEYVGVKYRNRDDAKDETVPWRIMGLVDGTTLTYSPQAPNGAPTKLQSGQVVKFETTAAFVVKSQDAKHPFYVSGHMSGCLTYGTADDCRGDSEFVNVVPAQQFLRSYVFFTDPTYPETNLVVVRSRGRDGQFADVSLDCAGPLTGWTAVGGYEYTRIDLVRHDFAKQGACDNGRQHMESTAPFGVTVWGWGSKETGGIYHIPQAPGFYTQAVSYAYPAGMSVRPINTVVVPATPN